MLHIFFQDATQVIYSARFSVLYSNLHRYIKNQSRKSYFCDMVLQRAARESKKAVILPTEKANLPVKTPRSEFNIFYKIKKFRKI